MTAKIDFAQGIEGAAFQNQSRGWHPADHMARWNIWDVEG